MMTSYMEIKITPELLNDCSHFTSANLVVSFAAVVWVRHATRFLGGNA